MLRFMFVLVIVSLGSTNNDTIPIAIIAAYAPHGIRVSLQDTKGVSEFFFWANVNEELDSTDLGKIQLAALEPTAGEWMIEDDDIQLTAGDVIHYILFVRKNGIMLRQDRMSYKVTEIIPRSTTTNSIPTTPIPYHAHTTSTIYTISTPLTIKIPPTTTIASSSPTTPIPYHAPTTSTIHTTSTPLTTKIPPTTTTASSSQTTSPIPKICTTQIDIKDSSIDISQNGQKNMNDKVSMNPKTVTVVDIGDCFITVEVAPSDVEAEELDINIF